MSTSSRLMRIRLRVLHAIRQTYALTLKRTSFGQRFARSFVEAGLLSRHDVHMLHHKWRPPTGAGRGRTASGGYVPPPGALPGFDPLNLRVDPTLAGSARLNVLLPTLRVGDMSGGPNTALILAARFAARGWLVRLIATDKSPDRDHAKVIEHIVSISGEREIAGRLEVADGFDRKAAVAIGGNDVFMATAWWTAQMTKYAVRLTRRDRFIYLIQDFEPLLHTASTRYALALETYQLPHIPVVNTKLLLDFLVENRVGAFADASFAASALYFEPAIDRSHFFPPQDAPARGSESTRPFRLLFYARPATGERNLFELGITALAELAEEGRLPAGRWELLAMGEPIREMPLAQGVTLKPLPWLGFEAYARTVREADVVLSLMLSPHPSYPPLEGAASGRLVVTNSYSVKTAERLQAISSNILVAAPTIESLIEKLADAIDRAEAGRVERDAAFGLPRDWDESFREVVPALLARVS